ncbi:hypothetical protein ACFYPN_15810 [Streptomyces sp. NPDC005576]|uniref:hypothetical protein n=1 Tax=Streptomyces sp. NPDC005576 TaxID=3364726 RepID=UPI0036C12F00
MKIHIGRWRLSAIRRAVYIGHEPNPNCPDCRGSWGGWTTNTHTDWDECHCLAQLRTWTIPLWPRTTRHYEEAPF